MLRAGFVAIVGLPNVGKSTLLNRILGQKIAITSPRPQTTRNRILGVHNLPGAQIVLVDTPGLHRPGGPRRSALNRFMVDEALGALEMVDAVLVVVEAPDEKLALKVARSGYRIGHDHRFLLDALVEAGKPALCAVNKVDRLHDKGTLLPTLDAWAKAHPFTSLVPISATTGDGVARLEAEIVSLLPESEPLFPEEMVTDRAERWLAAEMVREQVFLLTRQEVPYGVAVTIDTFEERAANGPLPADVVIEATIHVERDAQKRILVGEGGQMVREIGSRARLEIGKLLGCPVHLHLFVRVDEDWTANRRSIREMGYE